MSSLSFAFPKRSSAFYMGNKKNKSGSGQNSKMALKLSAVLIFSTLICYGANSQSAETKQFVKNSVITQQDSAKEVNAVIFTKSEIDAEYPGAPEEWTSYFLRNLNLGVGVSSGAPAGTYPVVIQFVIDTHGRVQNIVAKTNFGYGMEKEVIRTIKKGGKWKPAQQNGIPVKEYKQQSVTFTVN